METLKTSGEMDIVIAENTGQNVFWEFSVHRPPFDDQRVRQAVAHATDVETALMLIYGDLSMPEQCPISRGVFGNDQDFCAQHRAQYDPEKAKALLAEAGGWGPDNPLEVNLLVWTGGKRDRLAEVFQAQLAEVGIKANIEIMDIGTMNARVRQENETTEGMGSLDMMTWSWYDRTFFTPCGTRPAPIAATPRPNWTRCWKGPACWAIPPSARPPCAT